MDNEQLINLILQRLGAVNNIEILEKIYSIFSKIPENIEEKIQKVGTSEAGTYQSSNYESPEIIGKGGYGEIIKVKRKTDGKYVAIKKIPKTQRLEKIGLLPKEYVIMYSLNHPNIAKVYDIEEDDNDFYIIMELYEGGNLNNYLIEWWKSNMPPNVVLHIARQLIDAVGYCHNNNLVHRDIKLENILLVNREDMPHIVLTDFGFSKLGPIDQKLKDFHLTALYAAPEFYNLKPYLGIKSDVWAIGVCLYILFTGDFPFWEEGVKKTLANIANWVTSQEVFTDPSSKAYQRTSEECIKLIKWMLTKNPDARPTIKQIQAHPCYTKEYETRNYSGN